MPKTARATHWLTGISKNIQISHARRHVSISQPYSPNFAVSFPNTQFPPRPSDLLRATQLQIHLYHPVPQLAVAFDHSDRHGEARVRAGVPRVWSRPPLPSTPSRALPSPSSAAPVNAVHVSGADYCLTLLDFDLQLALVEFAVPVLHIVGIILTFVGFLLIAIQMEEGYNSKLKIHALNALIAGPIFWLIGSTQNICQVYQSASVNVQFLQKCVQVPHIMGSLFFLVAGILNKHDVSGSIASPYRILGKKWVWLCLPGSVLFFVGGLWNVAKVYKMQQITGVRLEKLRGCAHEILAKDGEDQLPLMLENSGRKQEEVMAEVVVKSLPTPYKDALLGIRS